MAGYMNDELRAIKLSLVCGHCTKTFEGTDAQARRFKYNKRLVFCTTPCRYASRTNKPKKPKPHHEQGDCPTCGKKIVCREIRKFCNMACYIASPLHKETVLKNFALSPFRNIEKLSEIVREELKLKRVNTNSPKRAMIDCLECGKETHKRSKRKKFCSKICWRVFAAKRFDRFISVPMTPLQMPEHYDAFLNKDELPCPFDGCEWKGGNLTLHVNLVHGCDKVTFKRMLGFNRSTGVVSKPVATNMRDSAAYPVHLWDPLKPTRVPRRTGVNGKSTPEAKASAEKRHALKLLVEGPVLRICKGCTNEFADTTRTGRRKYCTDDCRVDHYDRTSAAERREQK